MLSQTNAIRQIGVNNCGITKKNRKIEKSKVNLLISPLKHCGFTFQHSHNIQRFLNITDFCNTPNLT